MKELTFVINPFTSVEGKKVKYVGEKDYEGKRKLLNHKSYDFISYPIDGEDGLFTVSDTFLYDNPQQRVFGFKSYKGNYLYMIGDKSIYTIETNKSPKKVLKKLKESLHFIDDDVINFWVLVGMKKYFTNKVIYQPFLSQPYSILQ